MKKIIILFISLYASFAYSQQDAQYTQYMYNMSVINPAYTTGDIGIVNLGILHRTQWVGVNGAPNSTDIFAHTPISDKIEAGFSLVNDNIGGVVQSNNIAADFAYKLDLEENGTLSFGLKTGVHFFNVNFNGFNLESGGAFTDPEFANNINRTFLNIGAGVYYNTSNYYVGLSVPNFLKGNYLDRSNGQFDGTEKPHVFLTGGYVYTINELFKLKPAMMAKFVSGAPTSIDLTANVLYNNRLEFGIGYRINDALSFMANFRVKPELRIGYAYDHTNSNLGPFSSGSHELFILYDLDIFNLNLGYEKSPRFF